MTPLNYSFDRNTNKKRIITKYKLDFVITIDYLKIGFMVITYTYTNLKIIMNKDILIKCLKWLLVIFLTFTLIKDLSK